MKSNYKILLAIQSLLFTVCFSQPATTWKATGPNLFPIDISGQINGIGRVSQLKFHPSNPNKMYAVSASGGLWISSDTASTWLKTGTDKLPQSACASICIDHTNDNILYLGTGDANYYGTDFGVWKCNAITSLPCCWVVDHPRSEIETIAGGHQKDSIGPRVTRAIGFGIRRADVNGHAIVADDWEVSPGLAEVDLGIKIHLFHKRHQPSVDRPRSIAGDCRHDCHAGR